MIREIQIENFKSIPSLKMELGRFNVLIGANGCGKSNILEAIGMGCAAAEDKLEDEFLTSRGIRVTSPMAMRSGFSTDNAIKPISISFKHSVYREITFNLDNVNSYYSPWNSDKTFIEQFAKAMAVHATFEQEDGVKVKLNEDQAEAYLKQMVQQTGRKSMSTVGFSDFIIYAPENKYLRTFEDEGQIKPLGIRGEGLFKYLAFVLKDKEKKKQVVDILDLFDWFEDFDLPNNLEFGEKRIDIKDRFLQDGLRTFDQKSVNEGFLYVLFYSLLFIGEAPLPKFFAIDNIDNALNPKLGADLMKILAKLAEKHDKQVIFTTHNPAILDGLNLNDPEQRLFVISRNAVGHTKALRIEKKPTAENGQSVKLSEQFLRGYIGGLNF